MIDDNYMIPNDNFVKFFPESAALSEPPERSAVLRPAFHILVSKLVENNQIKRIAESIYGKDAPYFLDLLSYLIITEENVMQYYPDYAYEHPLFGDKQLSDVDISRILKRHSKQEHELFLNAWCKIHSNNEHIYISYDSTNMNNASEGIELSEYGYAKVDVGLPIINVSIAYDQDNSVPLFYEVYPGSLIDNTQCRYMVDRANKYGFNNVGFILDRGYFSKDNIDYFDEKGYDFLMMAKGSAKFVSEIIKVVNVELRLDTSHYILGSNVHYKTVEGYLYGTDNKTRYFHIFYNEEKASVERAKIYSDLDKMRKRLDKNIEKKITTKDDNKEFNKYFHLKYDNYNFLESYSDKESAIKEVLDKCGFFVLISSEEMTAPEALRKYRERDACEKLFRNEKSFLGGDVFRVHSEESLETKQLITFLALIVRNEIYTKTKELRYDDNKSYTVPAIIRELDKANMIKTDGTYLMSYGLSNKQKAIFKAFSITDKDYRVEAIKLSKKYND